MNIAKTQKELSNMCNCGTDVMRKFLLENGLYESFCEIIGITPRAKLLKCCICDSNHRVNVYKGNPYCSKHFNHMARYGEIIEKTIYDKNDYVCENNMCKIVLRDKYQNIKGYAIIDSEDYEKIRNYKWYLSAGYCVTKGVDKNSGIDLPNVIFNDNKIYDHINNNRLDNRRENLRPVDAQQNAMNMSIKSTNKTGVVGVQWCKPRLKWVSSITYNYKNIYLGGYNSFDEAVKVRLKAEAKYFREFSNNYNPETNLIEIVYLSLNDNRNKRISVNLQGEIIAFNEV